MAYHELCHDTDDGTQMVKGNGWVVEAREEMPLVTRMAALQAERAGEGTNGILECQCLSNNEYRTAFTTQWP